MEICWWAVDAHKFIDFENTVDSLVENLPLLVSKSYGSINHYIYGYVCGAMNVIIKYSGESAFVDLVNHGKPLDVEGLTTLVNILTEIVWPSILSSF